MPNIDFWRKRFEELGLHAVGPGFTKSEAQLEEHRQVLLKAGQPWIANLKGPVLDFGCGIGRWVMDLPRPYMGLDLLPEHLSVCRTRHGGLQGVQFQPSTELQDLADKSIASIFTCTVLQHIVEPDIRQDIVSQFHRVLADDGVLLSIEWSDKQRNLESCVAITQRDFAGQFQALAVCQVVVFGVTHNIWYCRKIKNLLSKIISLSRIRLRCLG